MNVERVDFELTSDGLRVVTVYELTASQREAIEKLCDAWFSGSEPTRRCEAEESIGGWFAEAVDVKAAIILASELGGLHAEVSRAEDEEDAVLLICERVDERLRRGDFAAVDLALAGAWDDLPALYSLALLSISYAAKDELQERVAFHARVRARLLREDRERVDELLAGF